MKSEVTGWQIPGKEVTAGADEGESERGHLRAMCVQRLVSELRQIRRT